MSTKSGFFNMNSRSDTKLKNKSDLHLARKIWHLCGVLFVAVLYNNLERVPAIQWSAGFCVGLLAFDLIRFRVPALNRVAIKLMKPIMRQREVEGFSGVTALVFGVLFIVYMCPPKIVLLTLVLLATVDPVASFFGVLYGKDRIIGNKSLQGAMAAFVCGTIVSGLFYYSNGLMTDRILIVSLITGLIASASELIVVGNLDDNFSFPVICSLLLSGLFVLFGAF